MTISPVVMVDGSSQTIFARAIRGFVIACLILLLWFSSMVALMALTNVAPAALVVMPNQQTLRNIPLHTKLVRSGEYVSVMTSTEPSYVLALYKAGAWLVLPALKNGCLELTSISKVKK